MTTGAKVELQCLEELGDPELVDELVEMFVALSAEQVVEMRNAIYGSDADLLAKAAHKLKGACLGLYATTAAELTAVIERSGKAGTLGALPGRLDDLETALEETIAQMRAYIARRAAPR